ncbi:hypothetical protein glysoja_003752 [Glycine soja]|nr:hypothetical protein glysoja_003752 [Glycine soja]
MGLNRTPRHNPVLPTKFPILTHSHSLSQTMKFMAIIDDNYSQPRTKKAALLRKPSSSVYKEVSETFNAGPSDLGYLTFIRNFVQVLSSPLVGILVINYDHPTILAMGTFCWALSTAAVGVCHDFLQVAFWRAINGFGLAIVIPALQSFIADSYKDGVRGTGFGLLSLIGNLGGIGGGVLATVMAGQQFWGIQGWRCPFILMATLSALIGFLVLLYVVDSRKRFPTTPDASESSDRGDSIYKGNASATSVWMDSWAATKAVIKVKTFQIIGLQVIIGSLPWTAMVFFTMWFELIGFDNNTSATLLSLFAIGCAMGSFSVGSIADKLSQVIPPPVSSFPTFSVTLFVMGLTTSWNGAAANAPMFAEVVPVKHRTMIYAFDRAFEGSFSSIVAPLVGILSEKVLDYNSKSVDPIKGSSPEALALSKGLLSMMAVPFGLCCLCYAPLYYIFRRDRENARMLALKEEEMM